MTRELPVDIAKGLGILLVVAGHTLAAWESGHESLHRFIYSFHMPLFLGISGRYISTAQSFREFIATKAARIIVPFLFWTLVYFIFEHVKDTLKMMAGSTNSFLPLLDDNELVALVHIPLYANWTALNSAGVFVDLWFLPALFSMVIIMRVLVICATDIHPGFMFLVTMVPSYLMTELSSSFGMHPLAIWGIDIAIAALPFVYLFRLRHFIYSQSILILLPLILTTWYFSKDTDVAMATLTVSNYPKFLIAACTGIAVILLLSKKLETSPLGSVLSKFGQRSYAIYVTSGIVGYLVGTLTKFPFLGTGDMANTVKCTLVLASTYFLYPLIGSSNYLRMLALGEPFPSKALKQG
ncbi:MAG: acyltransferase family protein [Nitrospira sp.]|nr:acyltransferase family protein [Nitrospira sp.]